MIAEIVAMSMIAHLKIVPPAQLAQLRKHPAATVAKLTSGEITPMPPNPKRYADVRASLLDTARFAARQMGIHDVELALQMAKENAPQFAKEIDGDKPAFAEAVKGPGDELLLAKAWHGVHYLLTGDAKAGPKPWSDAIMGGAAIGEDVGYGPAQLLEPADVKRVAVALQTLSPAAFRKRFDAHKLEAAQIYPSGWDDSAAEWLESAYTELREFYKRAAAQNAAVLIWIN